MSGVFATNWVAYNLMHGIPNSEEKENPSLEIYKTGLCWGAFAFTISALISTIIEILVKKITKNFLLKYCFIITQIISGIALMCIYFSNNFFMAFIIIPLTGFGLGTFNSIPNLWAEKISHRESVKIDIYENFFYIAMFFAQILTFCIVPICFLIFPKIDDTSGSLFFGGICNILSIIFVKFV